MSMTIEDINEYKKNAIVILRKNDQYATANAVEMAFNALSCLEQYIWERDIALSQLKELGLHFGEDASRVRALIDRDTEQEAVYKHKDGTFVCPDCGASTYPLILHGGDFCQHCGKRVKVRGIIKSWFHRRR